MRCWILVVSGGEYDSYYTRNEGVYLNKKRAEKARDRWNKNQRGRLRDREGAEVEKAELYA